jgi:hypothetical protein
VFVGQSGSYSLCNELCERHAHVAPHRLVAPAGTCTGGTKAARLLPLLTCSPGPMCATPCCHVADTRLRAAATTSAALCSCLGALLCSAAAAAASSGCEAFSRTQYSTADSARLHITSHHITSHHITSHHITSQHSTWNNVNVQPCICKCCC